MTPDPNAVIDAIRAATLTHPTRRITVTVSCVWTDGGEYEITLTDADRHDWRFTVADPGPYPVGSTIELEVPA